MTAFQRLCWWLGFLTLAVAITVIGWTGILAGLYGIYLAITWSVWG